jgi:hypothetical protein
MALPSLLDGVIHRGVTSPPCVLPEFNQNRDINNIGFGLDFPSFPYGGSMKLMKHRSTISYKTFFTSVLN